MYVRLEYSGETQIGLSPDNASLADYAPLLYLYSTVRQQQQHSYNSKTNNNNNNKKEEEKEDETPMQKKM